jgi:hypothetical protein
MNVEPSTKASKTIIKGVNSKQIQQRPNNVSEIELEETKSANYDDKIVLSPKKKQYSPEYCKQAQARSTITLTFGDQAENHRGMQKLGELADEGFSIQDLEEAKRKFEAKGCVCELVDLNTVLFDTLIEGEQAKVLIARKGIDLLNETLDSDKLFEEQVNLEWDTKAFMYGQVRNKHARNNLCYGEESQNPDYTCGKGRIVAFSEIPYTQLVRKHLGDLFGEKGKDLVAEGNYYYDVKECGIGYHRDTERKKVIGVRLGASIPLHYQWFLQGEPIGKRVELILNHGDIYVMSEKASGFDWRTKKKPTLRHAAGAKKFLTIKVKKTKRKEKNDKKKKKANEDEDGDEEEEEVPKITKQSKKVKKNK